MRQPVEARAAGSGTTSGQEVGGMSAHVYDGPTERVFFAMPDALDIKAAKEVWDSALCAQVDPELFFPEKGQSPREAIRICGACSVRSQCLDLFGDVLDFGVVGGLTEKQRRARRVAAAKGEEAA
jgi:WhiB family redox-sensing transcriptional regulator